MRGECEIVTADWLCRIAIVVLQQTTELFVALDRACRLSTFVSRVDDLVVQPLMVSLAVVVRQELSDGISQRMLAEQNQPLQALGF
ncbi:MAG: hypothetical protein CMJ64_10980 [Planctomycetaceae bacterium]|nr:hypothetical protein [Planctomycetaceae bacterium]